MRDGLTGNPGSCPADPALGKSIDIDFTRGGSDLFTTSGGTPTYSSDGVSFTVARSGDSPQLVSLFYIMFGRVEITMKAAPGNGIVSSLVFESDCLDEIDNEWIGADSSQVQTNYFGKGITGTYNRGQFNPAPNNQAQFITYTVDWTSDRIVWTVGGTVVRTLNANEAEPGQYPQTPMQIKFGSWSGGDPSNAPGTIEWAHGPTDYSQGPFSMVVQRVKITDYSTGSSYAYGDASGSWQSIRASGGSVNGNLGGAGDLTTTAVTTAASSTSAASVPVGGIGSSTSGSDSSTLPPGWVMTSDGKVVPSSSATVRMFSQFQPPFGLAALYTSQWRYDQPIEEPGALTFYIGAPNYLIFPVLGAVLGTVFDNAFGIVFGAVFGAVLSGDHRLWR